MTRLWDKGALLDERVLRFTAGEDYALDERLVRYDVRASIAHAEMLCDQKLLTAADCAALCEALVATGAAHERGEWQITLQDEDGQTALEKQLTLCLGAIGGRIHLGRSRNDQVLTALRLYLLDAVGELEAGALSVASALDALAKQQGAIALPGYTHMQQAMPSSVALWAGGFAAEIRDDARGITSVLRRVQKNPLGSAAGYGAPGLTLNRDATTKALGFDTTQEPVTSVQLSRGKAESQLLLEITLLTQDMGRLSADLLLFYTQEFAFVSLPDSFTTGSSIMPQKRNPDVFELLRGRSASALACLTEALAITAKLPSGYQRDLQLLKFPLFRGVDMALQSTELLAAALGGVQFRPERIKLHPALNAAEEAYAMVVKEGIPFREAYQRVGAKFRKE